MGTKRHKRESIQTTENLEDITEKYSSVFDTTAESSFIEAFDNKKGKKTKPLKEGSSKQPTEKEINWPEEDLSELLNKMKSYVPEKDSLVFSTRCEKLSWKEIAFKNYTAEECKETWLLIQKRLRRYRLLSELISDAREWITKPWTDFYKGSKSNRHPDMPPKPLSTYMIFYMRHKDKIVRENPGMDMTEVCKKIAEMCKNITPEKKEKYKRKAAKRRREYDIKLKEFFEQHPNFKPIVKHTSKAEVGPKRPQTPFGLYFEGQLKKLGPEATTIDKNQFREQCKEQWKKMSDKKKVIWINWAEEESAKYEEELKDYVAKHPGFVVPHPFKHILTKEEKLIKERIAGKPVKPPNSAYSLFSRIMLQGKEIKKISPKERMNYIAAKWKDVSDEEKQEYKERVKHMMEQYKLDFATYLESLPEGKQLEELQNNLPKRRVNKDVKPDTSESHEINHSETVSSPRKQKLKKLENAFEVNIKEEKHEDSGVSIEMMQSTPKKKRKYNHLEEEIISSTKKQKKSPNNEDYKLGVIKKKLQILEPKQPPSSVLDFFMETYDGDESPKLAWTKLSSKEKKRFEKQLHELKQQYIVEFEDFLKGLTHEEIEIYQQIKMS